ncbi:MAG: alpha/beta hydrolase [Candidatus Thioglobus sp.]|nr:alpha/beta hydrolase [Candidatus Thioglobus sp.]
MEDLEVINYSDTPSFFDKDGTAYKAFGDAPATLIFIHGVGMCKEIWQPQVEHFSKNYRVITYDFLGHGQSLLKKDKLTLEDYISQLYNLVNEIGVSNFSIIGHSMGALIAVAFALRYPEKVDTLIPINIVFKRTKKAQDDVIMRAKDVLKSQQIPNINQTLERWFKNKTSPYDLLKINNVQGWLKNTSPKAYSEAYYLFATSDRVFVNNLSNLQPPVLYLTGSEDPNSTSLMSEQMAQETPNGSSESIEGEAHMMAYISAKKVNPIIEYFLNNTYNTTT